MKSSRFPALVETLFCKMEFNTKKSPRDNRAGVWFGLSSVETLGFNETKRPPPQSKPLVLMKPHDLLLIRNP